MRQRFNEDKGLRRGVLLGCMILTITSISLFAASFKYISELQYCIRYNTVTQEMDENLYMDGEPGTYFEIVSYAKSKSFDEQKEFRETQTGGEQG